MTYDTTDDLPGPVRERLPPAAQELYLEAYNTAYAEYSAPDTDTDEDPRISPRRTRGTPSSASTRKSTAST